MGGLRAHLERAAQIERPETRVGAGGYVYTEGTNPKQRQPGQLPEVGLVASVGEALGRLFTPAERTQQRRIAHYLLRLAVALEDGDELEGWETAEDAAEACRLVLGPERAAALGEQLGGYCRDVIDVAVALGYEEQEGSE